MLCCEPQECSRSSSSKQVLETLKRSMLVCHSNIDCQSLPHTSIPMEVIAFKPLPPGVLHCDPPTYLLPGHTVNNIDPSEKMYLVLNGRKIGIHQDL
jgi:hypothetical protein